MSDDDDVLRRLSEQVRGLDDTDVSTHPDVLESVHRELAAELDELSGGNAHRQD